MDYTNFRNFQNLHVLRHDCQKHTIHKTTDREEGGRKRKRDGEQIAH